MKAKTKQILIGIIALGIVVIGVFGWRISNQDKADKTIAIQIVVDGTTIYDEDVDTNCGTLADLLKEMLLNKKILLEYSTSSYGMYIQGMGVDEIYMEEPNAGKYWTYNSENNAQCAKNNFCDAAEQLLIADGDKFVFSLEAYEG